MNPHEANHVAEVFERIARSLRANPYNAESCIAIMQFEGIEPHVVTHNASRSEAMVMLSKACEQQHSKNREPHKELDKHKYPACLYADVNEESEWEPEP